MVRRSYRRRRGSRRGLPALRPRKAETSAAFTHSDDGDDFVPSASSHTSSSSDPSVDIDDGTGAAIELEPPQTRKRKRGGKDKDEGEGKNKKKSPDRIWKVLEKEYEQWINNHIGDAAAAADANIDGVELEETPSALVDVLDPSPDVILPLLRFQKEWLAWAIKQENESPYRGGILADEMGMGKTIQAISLVLTARSIRNHEFTQLASSSSSSSSATLPTTKCTLVICPVVAVMQWVGEIDKYTREGSVRVLVYHGPQRKSAAQDFSNYDFVITTFSVVEADYRKDIAPPKVKCQWCGNLFYPNRLKFHLKYFCGPHAMKTDKQSKQASKKKKNKSVPYDQDGKNEGNVMQPNKANGPIKANEKKNREHKHTKEVKSISSILFRVKWERIILDEAHAIKCRKSSTARAVFSLQSSFKWALSGTPLQNRVGELFSLVRFLQVNPYSYLFCKDCDCMTLDYQEEECNYCSHKPTRHFFWWNRYIAKPIQSSHLPNSGKRALLFLRGKLLKSIVLRRTKKGRAADLAIPPRTITLRRDVLDRNEQEFYKALYDHSQLLFNSYVVDGTLLNNYAHVFELLTRLRQAVDHPYLVIYAKNSEAVVNSKHYSSDMDCCICHDPVEDPVVSSCKHAFCRGCLDQYSTALGILSCPSCSKPLTIDLTKMMPRENSATTPTIGIKRSSILNKINLKEFKASTKIDALREQIRCMIEDDCSAKGIVFSQFTSFLDLINYSLQKSGIKCVQLVGSMSMAERQEVISRFTDDANIKIFLMSLRAGGVALNLTMASHVFLMDPWWNPAVESQAQDRIHRLGQYKPIRVVRFVIKDTIEERILHLQEKKKLVVEGTIGESAEAMTKLTEKDLKFLFQT